jgi:hypothetical protein
MHAPPPVWVELGDEPVWRWGRALVWGTAILTVAAWAVAHLELPLAWLGLAFAIGLVACLGCLWRLRLSSRLRLAFDGTGWALRCQADSARPQACRVHVALDLGDWMLLRIDLPPPVGAAARGAGAPWYLPRQWRAVSPRLAGTAWQALRVALYCAEQGHRGRAGSGRPDE